MNLWKVPSNKDSFYHLILAVSRRDAWLFLWSVRMTVLMGFGAFCAFLFALLRPLVDLLRGSWDQAAEYTRNLIVWPLPFLIVLLLAALINRKVVQHYHHFKK
jgi:hypothetical protein